MFPGPPAVLRNPDPNRGRILRRTISLVLACLMVPYLVPPAIAEDSVESRIAAMPAGVKMDLRLEDKQTPRHQGARVEHRLYARRRRHRGNQMAFADGASMTQLI